MALKSSYTSLTSSHHIQSIEQEFSWFQTFLHHRLQQHLGNATDQEAPSLTPPKLHHDPTAYAEFVYTHNLDAAERLILMLALAPHVQPELLDPFFISNPASGRGFTEYGGVLGQNHGGFLPTGETAAFLVGGNRLNLRIRALEILSKDHMFTQKQVLWVESSAEDEPLLSGKLVMNPEYIEWFTRAQSYIPPFSARFPAKPIRTLLTWDDLVIRGDLQVQLDEVIGWMQHGETLLKDWQLERLVRPGYRCLFYGPPGTGKTLTATLLGQTLGKEVYRIDLAKVISKYIGETEKNLARVFDTAENKNWILFFDEADALFSKRTETQNSNDRSANQQVAYLLQRIEDYRGVAILATNLKENMDEAFTRRFDSMMYFNIPNPAQRLKLWRKYFEGVDKAFDLEEKIDLKALAHKYELTGGNLINVLRYTCIRAKQEERKTLHLEDIYAGVRKELHKMGKSFF
ncbi:MAG: ATP-binding protein [Bacteroidota bacterium]